MTIHCWFATLISRSAETAGRAMLTIVASRMTSRTVIGDDAEGQPASRVGLLGGGRRGRGGRRGTGFGHGKSSGRADGPDRRPRRNVTACDHRFVPVSLVLISDTHVPKRARDLPHSLWAAIETPTSSSTPATGSTSRCWTCSRSGPGGWSRCTATTTTGRSASGCPRSPAPRSRASASPSSTRPGTPRAASTAAPPASPTPTCWSSGTATSPGTRPRPPACGC